MISKQIFWNFVILFIISWLIFFFNDFMHCLIDEILWWILAWQQYWYMKIYDKYHVVQKLLICDVIMICSTFLFFLFLKCLFDLIWFISYIDLTSTWGRPMRENYRNYQKIEWKKNPKAKSQNEKSFQQTETTRCYNVILLFQHK